MSEPKEKDRIRLLLVDEQALFRASLSRLLAMQPGLEVAGESGKAAEALEILAASPVDVVLLGAEHATEGERGFIAQARKGGHRGQFLIVAAGVDAGSVALAIRMGASGIFLKSEAPERLIQAIQLVAQGAVWFDQRILRNLLDQPTGWPGQMRRERGALSDRERKVLLGVLSGLTNRKIGSNLGLSESAVKSAVQHLFQKSGVRTRSQLVRAALEGSLGAGLSPFGAHAAGISPLPPLDLRPTNG